MKFTIRMLLLIAVVASMAALAPQAAKAQSTNNWGLSADDYALFQAAQANQSKVTSFVADYTLSVAYSFCSAGSISVTGSGPLAIDKSKLSSTGAANPANAAAVTFQNTVSASATSGQNTTKGSAEIRLVGGVLYLKSDLTKGQWVKFNLAQLATLQRQPGMMSGMGSMMGGNASASGGTNPFSCLTSGLGGGGLGGSFGGASGGGPAATAQASGAAPNIMGILANPDISKAFAAIPNIPGAITAVASDDQPIDGIAQRKFVFTVDLAKIVSAPEFRPVVKALLSAAPNTGGEAISDDQVDMFAGFFSGFLSNIQVSATWLAGKDDKMFHGFGLNFNLNIDLSGFGFGLGDPNATPSANATPPGPLTTKIDFLVKLSKLNQPVKVDAVPDAIDGVKFIQQMMATPAAGS